MMIYVYEAPYIYIYTYTYAYIYTICIVGMWYITYGLCDYFHATCHSLWAKSNIPIMLWFCKNGIRADLEDHPAARSW